MAQSKLEVGDISGVSGELNVAGRDIIKNIKTIHQRALTAAEEAAGERKLESKLLAQGVSQLAQNLSGHASQSTEGDSPYKGLLPYNLNESEIFFGRNKAKNDLLKCIKQDALTVLHAESGAGKSSLLQAGIAAQLIANGHLAIRLRPHNADPVEFVKRTFLPDLTQAPALAKTSLHEFLRQVCTVLGSKANLYLLLDQFEEFFNLLQKEERQPFLESLADCLNDSSLKVRWVLTLRAEALSEMAELEDFGITPFKNTYRLNHLSRAEAQEAIIEPAKRNAISFEQALIDHILDSLTTNGEVTPTQLQLVCSALTDDLPADKTFTLAYYIEHEGDTEGILRDYLKRQLEHFPSEEQNAAWKVLRALITVDRLRAVKTYDEVVQELKLSGVNREQINTILARLVERRLLATQAAATETFELAHDYLVKEIELDPQEQARKAAQELLDQEVRTYQRFKTLLTEDRLKVIEPYISELRLSSEAEQLMTESQAAAQREQREEEARRQKELEDARRYAEAAEARLRAERRARRGLQILTAVLSLLTVSALIVLSRPYVLRAMAQGEMALIPAGPVVIGTDDLEASEEEMPEWTNELEAFQIDRYEVTNDQYRMCVSAGKCDLPHDPSDFNNPDDADLPVAAVTAYQADAYCRWLGKRLPTELEWERAARGPDGRDWPWGKIPLSPEVANLPFDDSLDGSLLPVKSLSAGATPQPEYIFHLIGNVWEWTSSYLQDYKQYDETLYWDSRLGAPAFGLVQRGGSWDDISLLRVTRRDSVLASDDEQSAGIRCAKSQ